jgi:hypothetical protein
MTVILVLPEDRADVLRAKSRALAMDEAQFIEQCLVRICGEPHEYVPDFELPKVADEKESATYWLPRLSQASYDYKGQKKLSANWSVKMSRNGKRRTFSFGRDKQQAAELAAKKYKDMNEEGRAA